MSGIFTSYRRDDSRDSGERLYDDLEDRFGRILVFRDINAIEPGADYPEVIDRAVARCDALIAVIGREWLDIRDASGRRRLDDANDLVRLEISAALAREKLVLPVLVEDHRCRRRPTSPPTSRHLAARNALPINDARRDYDIGRLVARLESVVRVPEPQRRSRFPLLATEPWHVQPIEVQYAYITGIPAELASSRRGDRCFDSRRVGRRSSNASSG